MTGRAKGVSRDTLRRQALSTALTSMDVGKNQLGLNRLMRMPSVTVSTPTLPATLLSITLGKWNVRVRILWIDFFLSLTPIKRKTANQKLCYGSKNQRSQRKENNMTTQDKVFYSVSTVIISALVGALIFGVVLKASLQDLTWADKGRILGLTICVL